MKKLLYFSLAALLFAACGNSILYDEERTFNNNVWNGFTPEVYTLDINNIEDYYNIDITVAVDTARYRYNSLPMTVNLYSPNDERRMFYADVALAENGRPKGEVIDGYRVVTGRIRSYFSFNSRGEHRMELGQATSQYDLEGIHSIRLTIEKAPMELPE
jgi:gliding motility-associated lipoprotein GldH